MNKHNGRLTRRKDLHDGRSLWADSPRTAVRTRKLVRDERFEIAVVGGGISGAIVALVLSAAGHEVAVFDRRRPGCGSTVASTAMIQFEIDTPLTELTRRIGAADAGRAYRRSRRAVSDLAVLIATHDIDARWIDRDALYLAGNEMGFRALMAEAEARRAIGLPSRYLSSGEVAERFRLATTGAILSNGSAELDPARTAAGCLRAAHRLGATLISPCEVTGIENGPDVVRLTTADGGVVTCDKVVIATGYEVIDDLPRDAFEIVSSWAIATKPVAAETLWRDRCLIWEAADPYLYLRTTVDNRILAGGEDSGLVDPKRRAAAVPAKSETLLRKLAKLLQRDDLEIDYAWAGAFADSPTGLPLFKPLRGRPRAFAMLGCGGNGITFSVIGAQVAKAWVEGNRDADANLFLGPDAL